MGTPIKYLFCTHKFQFVGRLHTLLGLHFNATLQPNATRIENCVCCQQLDKRKLVFLLFCGFERRLLATVRGTAATAVAFPQKSESTFPRQKSTGLDRDLSFFTYSLFIIHLSLFILLQVFALLFSFALNIMYTSRHLNQRSDTHEIHHQGGL